MAVDVKCISNSLEKAVRTAPAQRYDRQHVTT